MHWEQQLSTYFEHTLQSLGEEANGKKKHHPQAENEKHATDPQ
jgi:hypothetical protein